MTTITFPLNILSRANIGTPATDLLLLVTLEEECLGGLYPYLPTGMLHKGMQRATVAYEFIPDTLDRRPDYQALKRRRSASPKDFPKRRKIGDDADDEMRDISPLYQEASVDASH